jgi:hypothetical protein
MVDTGIEKVIISCPCSAEEEEKNRDRFLDAVAKNLFEFMKAEGAFNTRKEAR